jgi:hypothetical protein
MHFFHSNLLVSFTIWSPSNLAFRLPRSQSSKHFLLPTRLHLIPTNPIIPVNIPPTNPPRPRKRTSSMQYPPIIKNQHLPRHQLLPILILLLLEQCIKLPGRIVPHLDFVHG